MTSGLAALLVPIGVSAADPDPSENRALSDVPYKSSDGLTDYETERCQLDVYLVIFGDQDMAGRVDENELFVEMIRAAGNEGVMSLRVPDRNHGTIASMIADEGDPAREAILKFMAAR